MLSQTSFWIATWPLKAKEHCHDAPTESCVDCTTAPDLLRTVLSVYCRCGVVCHGVWNGFPYPPKVPM
jgi:hypothetical protein